MDMSTRSNVFSVDPVIQLMKDVIQEEVNRHILQTKLSHVYYLLLDISAVFQDQQKAAPEALKIWLQLLRNSLTEANIILHRYGPSQRQRRLDCLMCNPGRHSKRVKEWKVLFNYLFQRLEEEFSMFVTAPIQLMSVHRTPLSTDEARMLFRYYIRISLLNNDIKNLSTELPCPKLVSLLLSVDDSIEEVPSTFLVSLTSLKVLHLPLGQPMAQFKRTREGFSRRDMPSFFHSIFGSSRLSKSTIILV